MSWRQVLVMLRVVWLCDLGDRGVRTVLFSHAEGAKGAKGFERQIFMESVSFDRGLREPGSRPPEWACFVPGGAVLAWGEGRGIKGRIILSGIILFVPALSFPCRTFPCHGLAPGVGDASGSLALRSWRPWRVDGFIFSRRGRKGRKGRNSPAGAPALPEMRGSFNHTRLTRR
jgi:hypothetical protein